MTETPTTEPDTEAAEALMEQAAADLRAQMDTALSMLYPQRELLANLAGAGLTSLPSSEQPGEGVAAVPCGP